MKIELALIILLTLVSQGLSIKCFQCSSQRDPGCAELGEISASAGKHQSRLTALINATAGALRYYQDCDDGGQGGSREFFCRKMLQTIYARDKMELVIRSCGWEVHPQLECYQFENKGHSETVCQCFEDGCNTATNNSSYYLLILILTITGLLYS